MTETTMYILMQRAYYSDRIDSFLRTSADAILGQLVWRAGGDGASMELLRPRLNCCRHRPPSP